MDLLIEQGDYVPDGKGGFTVVEGANAVLQRVLYRLAVPLGAFLPLPSFGSELYLLHREKPSHRTAVASGYIQQALTEETDVTFDHVDITDLGAGELHMVVYLLWQGEVLSFSTTIV